MAKLPIFLSKTYLLSPQNLKRPASYPGSRSIVRNFKQALRTSEKTDWPGPGRAQKFLCVFFPSSASATTPRKQWALRDSLQRS